MSVDTQDPLFDSLAMQADEKPWYTRWWGVLLLTGAFFVVGGFLYFASQVEYYKNAFEVGNKAAFEGIFIDATAYTKSGEQVSRIEVETTDDPFWGDPQAALVMVEFSDFGCPYCKQNAPTIQRLRQEYGNKIKFIYRDFPLTYVHPYALIAAQAGSCAHEQGRFWDFHDLLFEIQGQYETEDDLIAYADSLEYDVTRFSQCLKSGKYEAEAQNDLQEGIRFGVKGTPTFYINGVQLSGVVRYETFKALIDRFLETL
jgi:protein-disulfide isomerase